MAREPMALVRQAAEALAAGRWVVFPTETGYALTARADRPEALARVPGGDLAWSLALPVGSAVAAWAGGLSRTACRLVRRCQPGPVTFVFAGAARSGPAAELPDAVRMLVAPSGDLARRKPAHDAILMLLEISEAPLVLGEPIIANSDWLASLGDEVALVIEAGPPRYDRPPTRVRISGDEWAIESPGVYDEAELRRLTACLILFVCTGNTCRSPMAEALCKVMLAERLGCGVDELPQRGWWVMSAGVAAYPGDVAAAEAHLAVQTWGGDLTMHHSRPIRPELAANADYLIAMTQNHLVALRELFPEAGVEPRLLAGTEDLPDPLGGDQSVYNDCAQLIRTHLQRLVAEVTS
jgi:protein-tyrosine phosphatase